LVYVYCRGDCLRLAEKDRLSGRCLGHERERETCRCLHDEKYDKNKTKLYDSRKISEKNYNMHFELKKNLHPPTNHLCSAVVITTSSILRYLEESLVQNMALVPGCNCL